MKPFLLLFTLLFFSLGNAQSPSITFDEGLTSPKMFLELPDFKNINIRDMAISPNYDELFFTLDGPKNAFRTIMTTKKVNGEWIPFKIASFSGKYHDIEPAFSPDGKSLFFASKRPLEGDEPKPDYDLWVTKKQNGSWQTPARLNEHINTKDNEYYPSVTNDGSLYFTATRMDTKGKEDIYKSSFVNGDFQPAKSIEGANTKSYEYNAYVSPDESFILYGSYGRRGSFGKGDLFISFNKDGKWQEGINLGDMINSNQIDYCPFVTFDKKFFFFTSEKTNVQPSYNALTIKTLKEELNKAENGVSRVYYLPFQVLLKQLQSE